MAPEAYTKSNPMEALDVQDLMSHWTEMRRRGAERALEYYETLVERMADAHVRTARTFDLPAMTEIAEAQAAMSRNLADAYCDSVRKLLEP
jgi:hypothetical protein